MSLEVDSSIITTNGAYVAYANARFGEEGMLMEY